MNDILKGEWGFDGVVISDWGGTHDTRQAITNGLDMEFGSWTNGLSNGASNAYDNYYLANPYLNLIREGKVGTTELDDKVRNKTVEDCLEDAAGWTTKTSAYRDTIRSLAENELIPLLTEAEKLRPANNMLVNSCDLSLRYLNNLRLLAHIDEEVRIQNQSHNRFLLSDTNALLHSLIREGDASFVYEKIGTTMTRL